MRIRGGGCAGVLSLGAVVGKPGELLPRRPCLRVIRPEDPLPVGEQRRELIEAALARRGELSPLG
ncbi:hypothetical protein AB0J72_18620 [Dactylosporangium sp. NPDC049742]|uniref:hypothetical protein n=1 Tax=Dactylosporangium sp. NPDC049742 TaxID=3154737 RepID=UPI00341EF0AD